MNLSLKANFTRASTTRHEIYLLLLLLRVLSLWLGTSFSLSFAVPPAFWLGFRVNLFFFGVVRVLQYRSVAFVTYVSEFHAQFAKDANLSITTKF